MLLSRLYNLFGKIYYLKKKAAVFDKGKDSTGEMSCRSQVEEANDALPAPEFSPPFALCVYF